MAVRTLESKEVDVEVGRNGHNGNGHSGKDLTNTIVLDLKQKPEPRKEGIPFIQEVIAERKSGMVFDRSGLRKTLLVRINPLTSPDAREDCRKKLELIEHLPEDLRDDVVQGDMNVVFDTAGRGFSHLPPFPRKSK